MRKTATSLLAAGTLALGLAGPAMAESHMAAETGADCPEDMNTSPGCQLEGAETSERGPVEGAATAPVAPDGDEEAGDKAMTGPDDATPAEGEAGTGDAAPTDAAARPEEDAEADCPEDMDTAPGCQLEGAETSERGPVEGAATAPVAPDGDAEAGDKAMTGPDDATPAEGEGGADGEGQDGASAAPGLGGIVPEGHPEFAAVEADEGRYYTEAGTPTFKVLDDGTVDWLTYSGFRRYHSECHVCHGPEGMGSTYAPALKDSAVRMDYYDFYDVVVNGRKHVDAAANSVMPAFGDNPNVMCYLDDIYVYLLARGTDVVPRGRPGAREDKTDMIRDAENACLG